MGQHHVQQVRERFEDVTQKKLSTKQSEIMKRKSLYEFLKIAKFQQGHLSSAAQIFVNQLQHANYVGDINQMMIVYLGKKILVLIGDLSEVMI